jgi:hypothetical protein
MAVPELDRVGMLVVHAYVDRGSQELRASVTFAGDLTNGTETTQVATSPDEVLELVRVWLEAGNGPVTSR